MFGSRAEEHYQKYKRARKHETQRKLWELYGRCSQMSNRYYQLYLRISKRESPFSDAFDEQIERSRWMGRLKDKEKKRQEFLQLHRYSMWYMSNSFGSDYGRFNCDRCGYEFFHSPSTITLAAKTVYNCCCGSCTNSIIKNDHGTNPYE